MIHISEDQQSSDFPEILRENFRTICPFFESSSMSSWMESAHDLFREVRTFSISFRFSWNMYRTRPWRGARTAAISHGQIDAAICSRRWYQNIYRDTITFLFSFVGLNSTHRHDAIGAWYNSGNQAIAMHRYGVKAWEPISDKCVHVFYSYSHQPSGGLDDTVGDGLHFKTDQLGALAAVCEDNSWNHDVILEDFLQGKKRFYVFRI